MCEEVRKQGKSNEVISKGQRRQLERAPTGDICDSLRTKKKIN